MLEKTWARRFGVRRSGGMYRIAHWELMERFKELQQTPVIGDDIALVTDIGPISVARLRSTGEGYSPFDLLSPAAVRQRGRVIHRSVETLRICGDGTPTIHDPGISAQITPKYHHRVPPPAVIKQRADLPMRWL
ncbi:MAG: hypothetical protein ACRDTX_23390 [Pseudonocardiaceae bacterium]